MGIKIIAEISANHGHSILTLLDTIREAKKSGADVVKLQTYLPETMTLNSAKTIFRVSGNTIWDGENLFELYSGAYTPWDWHHEAKVLSESLGINFF